MCTAAAEDDVNKFEATPSVSAYPSTDTQDNFDPSWGLWLLSRYVFQCERNASRSIAC